MGEGWGDFFATILRMSEKDNRYSNFSMGEYSAGRGIRNFKVFFNVLNSSIRLILNLIPLLIRTSTNLDTGVFMQKVKYGQKSYMKFSGMSLMSLDFQVTGSSTITPKRRKNCLGTR